MYDSDIREVDVTAVDTPLAMTALGASTPGNFIVPTATKLTEVRISCAPDWTADAMYGFSSGVFLTGGGIKSGGSMFFGGPCGFTCGAAATSAGATAAEPEVYHTNIDVSGGGEITATAAMMGEDIGSLHVVLELTYDGIPGRIVDADYRENSLTAANTFVQLTDRHGAGSLNFKPPTSRVAELRLNAGAKFVAGPLRAPNHFQLYGTGLLSGGNYNFIGRSYSSQDDIAISGKAKVYPSVRKVMPPMLLKPTMDRFDVQSEMIEDDVGTLFAIATVCYM